MRKKLIYFVLFSLANYLVFSGLHKWQSNGDKQGLIIIVSVLMGFNITFVLPLVIKYSEKKENRRNPVS